MKIFEKFNPSSRVWIYQSNRPFTLEEENKLSHQLKQFTSNWTAHDDQLKADSEILFNRFIVFAVDEDVASVSGCSIDKSLHFIKQAEKDFNIFLLNRQLIAYKENDKILSCPLNSFIKLYKDGKLTDETIIFNNTVDTLSTFQTMWEIPLKNSWIYQHLQTEKAF